MWSKYGRTTELAYTLRMAESRQSFANQKYKERKAWLAQFQFLAKYLF